MNIKQAVAFIIVVSNGPGLMNTSPDRIAELRDRFSGGNPLWHLDEANQAIYRDWLKIWGIGRGAVSDETTWDFPCDKCGKIVRLSQDEWEQATGSYKELVVVCPKCKEVTP